MKNYNSFQFNIINLPNKQSSDVCFDLKSSVFTDCIQFLMHKAATDEAHCDWLSYDSSDCISILYLCIAFPLLQLEVTKEEFALKYVHSSRDLLF